MSAQPEIQTLEQTLTPYDFTFGDVALLQRRARERGVTALKLLMTLTGCSEDEGSSWLAEVRHRGMVKPSRKKTDQFYGDRT